MSNYGNAFFSPESKQYPGSVMPVWLEVKERKIAGGTFSLSGVAKGTIFAAGMPVRLDKMGGTVTILPTFTVVGAVSSSATTLVLRPQSGVAPAEGMIVGKMTSAGVAAKAVAELDARPKKQPMPEIEDDAYDDIFVDYAGGRAGSVVWV